MVRSIAERHGMRATFMPKPFADLTGSGCHAHVSVWRGENNLFAGSDEVGLSPDAHHFAGGLLAHAEALCALTNPTVNSYKRINAPVTVSGATWSPNTATWGGNNRTHMIRIPVQGGSNTGSRTVPPIHICCRLHCWPRGSTDWRNKRDPGKRLDVNMYEVGHTIDGRAAVAS